MAKHHQWALAHHRNMDRYAIGIDLLMLDVGQGGGQLLRGDKD